MSVSQLVCGPCATPLSLVPTHSKIVSAPSSVCRRVCKAADFFQYAVHGTVAEGTASVALQVYCTHWHGTFETAGASLGIAYSEADWFGKQACSRLTSLMLLPPLQRRCQPSFPPPSSPSPSALELEQAGSLWTAPRSSMWGGGPPTGALGAVTPRYSWRQWQSPTTPQPLQRCCTM